MKEIFPKGSKKSYSKIVLKEDIATFESGTVHAVYSTFALARDAEWSGRLFVLEMKEADEEGIGTRIDIKHVSPAFVGDSVTFTATFEEINEQREIITTFVACCGERLIAQGTQGQKILKKEKINRVFDTFKK